MAFVKLSKITNPQTKNMNTVAECRCDFCGEKSYRKPSRIKNENDYTFCNIKCQIQSKKKGEILYEKKKKTIFERTGYEHTFQIPENITKAHNKESNKKRETTCEERYGVKSTFKSKIIQEQIKNYWQDNFGVSNPNKLSEIRKKIEKTMEERYGVKNPQQNKEIREKTKQTNINRYDFPYPIQNLKIQEKQKQTMKERYGVEYPFQNPEIYKKQQETLFNNYGVENPMKSEEIKEKIDWKEMVRKQHKTKKENGTYGKSKIEDQFYQFLLKHFSENDIERQSMINEWNVDFCIKSLNLYIQFDGSYYHGLDRPIQEIFNFKTSTDKTIFQTYLRDQKQNDFFHRNKKKLFRISDKEFDHYIKSDPSFIFSNLLNFYHGNSFVRETI